jgi:hypothetical protein
MLGYLVALPEPKANGVAAAPCPAGFAPYALCIGGCLAVKT